MSSTDILSPIPTYPTDYKRCSVSVVEVGCAPAKREPMSGITHPASEQATSSSVTKDEALYRDFAISPYGRETQHIKLQRPCSHILSRGKRSGQICGRPCFNAKQCSNHSHRINSSAETVLRRRIEQATREMVDARRDAPEDHGKAQAAEDTSNLCEATGIVELGKKCTHRAHWLVNGVRLCKRHSTKLNNPTRAAIMEQELSITSLERSTRTHADLRDNPALLSARKKRHLETIVSAQMYNAHLNRYGQVRCAKHTHGLYPHLWGYLNVSISCNRKWRALHSRSLISRDREYPSLEAWWEAAKVYPDEMDGDKPSSSRPRLAQLRDIATTRDAILSGVNRGVPACYIIDGKQVSRETAVSTYFEAYKCAVTKTDECNQLCRQLLSRLRAGYNLQILGYGGVEVHTCYPNGKRGVNWDRAIATTPGPEVFLCCILAQSINQI